MQRATLPWAKEQHVETLPVAVHTRQVQGSSPSVGQRTDEPGGAGGENLWGFNLLSFN